MVLFGGLEIVAAGYLLNRHYKNKEEKERLEAEAAALEEQQYRIYSPDHAGPGESGRRRRAHSHDRERRRRYDGKDRRGDRKDKWDSDDEGDEERRRRRREREDDEGGRAEGRRRREEIPQRPQQRQDAYPPTGIPANWQQRPHQRPPQGPLQGPPQQHPYPPNQYPPPPNMNPNIQVPQQFYPPPPPPNPNQNQYRPPPPPQQAYANNNGYLAPDPESPRGRASSAPPLRTDARRRSDSRVRIAVPGEEELTVPGESDDAPPPYRP